MPFRPGAARALLVPVLALVGFGPALGSGFARDDFRWLWHARLDGAGDLSRILSEPMGFFRPATALAWAADRAWAGDQPLGFGLTNLGLHVVALVAFGALVQRRTGDRAAAVLAVLLASTSFHYLPAAVVWLSGRGALLAAAASCMALLAWERWLGERRTAALATAVLALAVALFAYEGAGGVPLLLVVWWWVVPRPGNRPSAAAGVGVPLATLAAYLAARTAVGAMQPWAPTSGYAYRATAVAPNLLEYLARAATPALVVLAALLAVAAAARTLRPAVAALGGIRPATLTLSIAWFLAGILPALPVPRRSDLYVYFGALGVHFLAGVALARAWRHLRDRRPDAATLAATSLVLAVGLLWPLYAWDRVRQPAAEARLATRAVVELRAMEVPDSVDCFVFVDDRSVEPDLHAAFSTHLPWVLASALERAPTHRAWYAEETSTEELRDCTRVARVLRQVEPRGDGRGRGTPPGTGTPLLRLELPAAEGPHGQG